MGTWVGSSPPPPPRPAHTSDEVARQLLTSTFPADSLLSLLYIFTTCLADAI